MQISFRSLIYSVAAAVSFLGAAALILSAGLPDRDDYVGFRLEGVSQRVAADAGALAPPLIAETLVGETVDLWALRGSPIIVNFWATWCGPCREEMPELQLLYDRYSADGLRILAVNGGEPRGLIVPWVESFGLTYDILLDPGEQIARDYDLFGYPTTVVIGPNGAVTRVFRGPVNAETLRQTLNLPD